MNLTKLYTKCGEQIKAVLCRFLEKLCTLHTLCVIFVSSDNRKCMEELNFTKMQQWTAIHSRFNV